MDKKLITLIVLFFATFLVFAYIVLFEKPFSQFIRAKEEYLPSRTNSLIFAWPIKAKVSKSQRVEINVFVRNGAAVPKPIANRLVTLQTSIGQIQIVKDKSDKGGRTTFYLTSDSVGIANLSAIVDNSVPLSQRISIKFE